MKAIVNLEPGIKQLVVDESPNRCPELLSKAQRERALERSFVGLYKWYIDRSQRSRSWNADRSFPWDQFGKSHSPEMMRILEGFFAVEQFNPDYAGNITHIVRASYGRAGFQVSWGSEEMRHSDLWRNCLLASGQRSIDWLDDYVALLRGGEWTVPWDDPTRMLLYQVIQERATQLNYLNAAQIARGDHPTSTLRSDVDPVLAEVARLIAIDEAAHYNFFIEGARLLFYYKPEETAQALIDVIKFYSMPGRDLVPDYASFADALRVSEVFLVRKHYLGETLKTILDNLGVATLAALDDGIKRCRLVPDTEGRMRETTLFESLDYGKLEDSIKALAKRINAYEDDARVSCLHRTQFIPNPAIPSKREEQT
ncbi:MAG: acyl-ACP desaturase [Fimbriimonas sp.]|nr:acyl-ACP desaturase [Fimbriimonas sp.]